MQTDVAAEAFTHCELSAPSLKRPLRLSLFLLRPLRVTEEESTATTMEALKARIRELERQILRGDRYKCLICMVSIPPSPDHQGAPPCQRREGVVFGSAGRLPAQVQWAVPFAVRNRRGRSQQA